MSQRTISSKVLTNIDLDSKEFRDAMTETSLTIEHETSTNLSNAYWPPELTKLTFCQQEVFLKHCRIYGNPNIISSETRLKEPIILPDTVLDLKLVTEC